MEFPRWMAVLLLTLATGSPAMAAEPATEYPSKPIRFIVPAPAGGPSDVIARLVAEELSHLEKQPVLVENKPGASQTLGTAMVARAAPDGYTLLVTTSTPIVMTPFTMKNLPYDVERDLILVSHIGSTPLVLYANASVPVTSVRDLLALAKTRPGALSYGSYGTGSSAHLLVEYLGKQTGTKFIHVPYKGVAPEISDLVAGQINFGVADIGVPTAFVRARKLTPLAVSGTTRAAALPGVATFAEQGVGGMEPFSPWWGLFAPAGTPRAIVNKLSTEVVRIVKSPEFGKRLASVGVEPTGLPEKAATEMMLGDIARWRKVISELPDIRFD